MISAHFWAPVRGAKFDRKLAEANTRWRDFSLNRDSCAATLLYTAVVCSYFIKCFEVILKLLILRPPIFEIQCQRIQRQKSQSYMIKRNKVSLLLSCYFRIFKTFILCTVFSRKFLKRKKKCWHPGLFTSTTNGMHFFEIVILISLHFYTGHISI